MKEQIDLLRMGKLFLKNWWKIGVSGVVLAVIMFMVSSFLMTPMYYSKGSLYVNNKTVQQTTAVNITDIASAQQMAVTCIELLNSETFMHSVQEASGLDYTVNALRNAISVGSKNETEIITVSAMAYTPEEAKVLVDSVLSSAQEEINRIIQAGNVKVIDSGSYPTAPATPNIPRNTILGFLFGTFLTMAVLAVLDIFDTRIKSDEDLMDVCELPMLGIIPDIDVLGGEGK